MYLGDGANLDRLGYGEVGLPKSVKVSLAASELRFCHSDLLVRRKMWTGLKLI